MEAKKKAEELITKFLRVEDDTVFYWEPFYDMRYTDDEVKEHAIKCAKITVSEIIELENFSIEGREFWNEVRTEIEALL